MEYKIIDKKDFPSKLKKIKSVPKKLYAIGNIDLLKEDSFAIVGTRKVSEYGIKNCKFFTKELVLRGIPIVSGMALGTDTVAHRTALEYGGKTIAVLGSGFNNIFPKENTKLFYDIAKNDGLIITEFEEDMKPLKENFPKRNRIITAISEGILVIESAYRSGTSITARNAREQGKKVFALPGRLDSYLGIGVNNLIKEGAILTTSIEDIVQKFPQFINKKCITDKEKKTYVDIRYKEIYDLIKENGMLLDELLVEMNLEFKELIQVIANMELEELIYQDIDGRYKVKASILEMEALEW